MKKEEKNIEKEPNKALSKTNVVASVLSVEHLIPYLPFGLKTNYGELIGIRNWIGWCGTFKSENGENNIPIKCIKPIFRDLFWLKHEDFQKDIIDYYKEFNFDISLQFYDSGNNNPNDITLAVTYKFMRDVFTDILINRGSTKETPNHFFNWLCKNDFDVFNLIDQDLAYSISDEDVVLH